MSTSTVEAPRDACERPAGSRGRERADDRGTTASDVIFGGFGFLGRR